MQEPKIAISIFKMLKDHGNLSMLDMLDLLKEDGHSKHVGSIRKTLSRLGRRKFISIKKSKNKNGDVISRYYLADELAEADVDFFRQNYDLRKYKSENKEKNNNTRGNFLSEFILKALLTKGNVRAFDLMVIMENISGLRFKPASVTSTLCRLISAGVVYVSGQSNIIEYGSIKTKEYNLYSANRELAEEKISFLIKTREVHNKNKKTNYSQPVEKITEPNDVQDNLGLPSYKLTNIKQIKEDKLKSLLLIQEKIINDICTTKKEIRDLVHRIARDEKTRLKKEALIAAILDGTKKARAIKEKNEEEEYYPVIEPTVAGGRVVTFGDGKRGTVKWTAPKDSLLSGANTPAMSSSLG